MNGSKPNRDHFEDQVDVPHWLGLITPEVDCRNWLLLGFDPKCTESAGSTLKSSS